MASKSTENAADDDEDATEDDDLQKALERKFDELFGVGRKAAAENAGEDDEDDAT